MQYGINTLFPKTLEYYISEKKKKIILMCKTLSFLRPSFCTVQTFIINREHGLQGIHV